MVQQLVTAGFQVGPKGRVVIPAALRAAAGISEGTKLVGRVEQDGTIVLESAHSMRDRVWAAAPTQEVDVVEAVRAARTEDRAASDVGIARRLEGRQGDDGAALLSHLGL